MWCLGDWGPRSARHTQIARGSGSNSHVSCVCCLCPVPPPLPEHSLNLDRRWLSNLYIANNATQERHDLHTVEEHTLSWIQTVKVYPHRPWTFRVYAWGIRTMFNSAVSTFTEKPFVPSVLSVSIMIKSKFNRYWIVYLLILETVSGELTNLIENLVELSLFLLLQIWTFFFTCWKNKNDGQS